MRTVFRILVVVLIAAAVSVSPDRAEAQWKYGWTSEFFVPVGDLADISLIGISAGVYAGRLLGKGRRSPWALEFDTGIHWFVPRDLTVEEVPDWVEDPVPDSDGLVKLSGSFIPVRGSITRFFGRYYFSPRLGIYLPLGDFKNHVGFEPSFGVAPRLGYFFFMSRELQFDLALEYDYIFGDRSLQYFGLSFGLFFGGKSLRPR